MTCDNNNRFLALAMLCALTAAADVFAADDLGPFPKGHPIEVRASVIWPEGITKGHIVNVSDEAIILDVRIANGLWGPRDCRDPGEASEVSTGRNLLGPKGVAGGRMAVPVTEVMIRRNEYVGNETVLEDEGQWWTELRGKIIRDGKNATWSLGYGTRVTRRGAGNALNREGAVLSSNDVTINPVDVRRMKPHVKPKPATEADTEAKIADVERFRFVAEFDQRQAGTLYLDVICKRPKQLRYEKREKGYVPDGLYVDLRTIEPESFKWTLSTNGKELAAGALTPRENAAEPAPKAEADGVAPPPLPTDARPVLLQGGQLIGRMIDVNQTPIMEPLRSFFDNEKKRNATCTLTFTATCRIPTGPTETPAAGEEIVGTLAAEPLTITREVYERISSS